MAINFFLQSRDFGGAEKFAQDLLTEFSKQKQEVFLYTTNLHLIKTISKQKNIKVEKIPFYLDYASNHKGLLKSFFLTPFAGIYYLKTLWKIKNRQNKQFIFCSGFSEKIILSPLAKFFALKVFFIEYGPLEPLFKKLYGIPKFLYYFLAKNQAKKIIVSSQNTKKALENIFSPDKMLIIPCGSQLKKHISKKNKVEKGLISVISRLEKGKGQDLAISAFKEVQKEFKEAKLQIIGAGNFYEELKKQSQNNPQIKFLKYVEEKDLLIQRSEIILCPSVWDLEGFGLVVIEAMSLQKPIVAFDRAPYNEILHDKTNALLAKNKNYNDLAKKIIFLMRNKAWQKKLSQKAYLDFQKKYQIEKIAKQYLTLLQN